MSQRRRYTVKATWQSGETKTLGFVREGRAEAYAAHAHRFGAAVTLTDTETGVVLLEMNGPFPVAIAPERAQQRIESFEWGGPMGGTKTDVFAAGASDFAAEWLDLDGNRRLGGFLRFTGSQPGGTTLGGSSLIYRYTVAGADKASIDTGVDAPNAGTNDWTNGDVLEVVMLLRTDEAGAQVNVDVNLNNDTGANQYDFQQVFGSAAATGATPVHSTKWALTTHGSGGTANYGGTIRLLIPGYADTTLAKTADQTGGTPDAVDANQLAVARTLGYRGTAAITRFKVAAQGAAKLKVGSKLLIYKRLSS